MSEFAVRLRNLPVEIAPVSRVRALLAETADTIEQQEAEIERLRAWIKWCYYNCDDSAIWNFGTIAAGQMKKIIDGEPAPPLPWEVSDE